MNIVKIEVNGLDITVLAEKIDNLTNALTGRVTETTATAPEEKLLTRTETAQMLGVTKPTIIDWGKKGILKCYRIGNRVRYKQSEVMETLTSTKVQ
ncbi:helix-turn-helix domain-containing protein [Epilithonimonas sp.]|uniref:helix-turn-helix domain-containing protein n=1 Tax=Epilithonimonas sp. TaxID=2894511 RepID=UPI00289A593C|nr:helix-turn-helix domain-containing protein [Epilithonimonas sp.]